MEQTEDRPFGKDGKYCAHATLTTTEKWPLSPELIDAILKFFDEKYAKKSNLSELSSDMSWYGLEKCLKQFIVKVRRARKAIEQRYKIKLPPGSLRYTVRHGRDHKSPIVAEVDEKRAWLYRRA